MPTMKLVNERHAEAEVVSCPTCGAMPGQRCVAGRDAQHFGYESAKEIDGTHWRRIQAARQEKTDAAG